MVSDINKLGLDVKWQDLTPGCTIVGSCTAEVFRTGEWRVDTPEFIEDKCKQCLLCVPVCPDSSIPVKEGGEVYYPGELELLNIKQNKEEGIPVIEEKWEEVLGM